MFKITNINTNYLLDYIKERGQGALYSNLINKSITDLEQLSFTIDNKTYIETTTVDDDNRYIAIYGRERFPTTINTITYQAMEYYHNQSTEVQDKLNEKNPELAELFHSDEEW